MKRDAGLQCVGALKLAAFALLAFAIIRPYVNMHPVEIVRVGGGDCVLTQAEQVAVLDYRAMIEALPVYNGMTK